MLEKLVTWFFFSVVLAVVPIAAAGVFQATRSLPFTLEALCAQGELLIVAAGLCAAATGELFASSAKLRAFKLVVGGLTVAVLFFAAIYFASVLTARQGNLTVSTSLIYETSLAVYFSALLSSGACVALSKV